MLQHKDKDFDKPPCSLPDAGSTGSINDPKKIKRLLKPYDYIQWFRGVISGKVKMTWTSIRHDAQWCVKWWMAKENKLQLNNFKSFFEV